MHFKLNWIFIDGIHFKRIENWLHNGSRKTQKHDVNLTLNECHRTIRYQKKGEWTSKSLRCCGSEFFLLFLQKKCDIIFLKFSFDLVEKENETKKVLNLILRRNPHTWNTITSDSLLNSLSRSQLIRDWFTVCAHRGIAKNKNILSHNPTDHTLNLAAKTVNSWQNELRLELDLRAYSIKCAQCFNLYTVECRWATSGWFVWT